MTAVPRSSGSAAGVVGGAAKAKPVPVLYENVAFVNNYPKDILGVQGSMLGSNVGTTTAATLVAASARPPPSSIFDASKGSNTKKALFYDDTTMDSVPSIPGFGPAGNTLTTNPDPYATLPMSQGRSSEFSMAFGEEAY